MEINAILRYVTYAAYIVLLISWPVRQKKFQNKVGSLILPLKRKCNPLIYAVLVCAPLLVILQTIRDFGLLVNAVLCGCTLFAAEAVIRDRITNGFAGVYEHALAVDGRFLLLNDIIAFPTLSYEEGSDMQEELYARSLKVVTRNTGVIFVGFADAAERETAVAAVLKLKPELKL